MELNGLDGGLSRLLVVELPLVRFLIGEDVDCRLLRVHTGNASVDG